MTSAGLVTICGVLAALLMSPPGSAAQGDRGAPPPAPGQDIGPLEKQANAITPENPLPRRHYVVTPLYPQEALSSGLAITFTVKATLGQKGRVDEARVTGYRIDSALTASAAASVTQFRPAFTKAALDAVRQWLYDPPAAPPISFYVQVKFVPGAESSVVWHDAAEPRAVQSSVAPPSSTQLPGPVRVGGNIPPPMKIKDVKPVYPPAAASAKVTGIVIIETVIGVNGRVADARVIRSVPLLDEAALAAVRQWEFIPTLIDGVPTPVIMSVTLNFQLN